MNSRVVAPTPVGEPSGCANAVVRAVASAEASVRRRVALAQALAQHERGREQHRRSGWRRPGRRCRAPSRGWGRRPRRRRARAGRRRPLSCRPRRWRPPVRALRRRARRSRRRRSGREPPTRARTASPKSMCSSRTPSWRSVGGLDRRGTTPGFVADGRDEGPALLARARTPGRLPAPGRRPRAGSRSRGSHAGQHDLRDPPGEVELGLHAFERGLAGGGDEDRVRFAAGGPRRGRERVPEAAHGVAAEGHVHLARRVNPCRCETSASARLASAISSGPMPSPARQATL